MNKYSIINVNTATLASQLGASYTTIIKYKHNDPKKFNEYMEYVDKKLSEGKKGSIFGLPLLSRYAILSSKDKDGNETSLMLETLVINVNRSKNIIKNIVVGVDGTTKEFIANGDYDITITGSLIGKGAYSYDDESIFTFRKLCDVKKEIEISNEFLNNYYKIKNIVIEEDSLMQSPDFTNILFFTIKCISDNEENGIMTQYS